jgi:predicted SprT family Zn-dependent metalloprotease
MPIYDDPDYEWKRMLKKNDVDDPFTNPPEEVKEAMKKIKEYECQAKKQLWNIND